MATGTFYPAAITDTAYWSAAASDFGYTAENLSFGWPLSTVYHSFVRVPADIPQGALITSAVLTLVAERNLAGTCPLVCHVALADDITAPGSIAACEALVLSDGIDWSPPDFILNTAYSTPDLSALVQQVVDRSGFASGSHILIAIKGVGSTAGRTAWNRNHGVSYPSLSVEWSDAPAPVDPTDYEVSSPASLAITTFGPEIFAGQNKVYEWEADQTLPFGPFTWKSKLVLLPAMTNFTAARVEADFSADQAAYFAALAERQAILARNAARISAGGIGGEIAEAPIGTYTLGGDSLEAVPSVGAYSGALFLRLKVYADGVLKQTVDIFSSKPFRLKGGYRSKQYSFQIEGNIAVKKVEITTSIGDLVEA